jgi:hypothetical protein
LSILPVSNMIIDEASQISVLELLVRHSGTRLRARL